MAETKFDGECCTDMVEMKTWRSEHEKRHGTLDDILDRLLNRLPVWVTIVFSIGGGIIGSLLTVIGFLLT